MNAIPPDHVRATLPTLAAAREAIARLEHRGIDAGAIRFEDETLARAAAAPGSGGRDERVLDRALRSWSLGVGLGVLAGGLLGALAGLALFGAGSPAAVLAVALGGAGGGAGVGFFAGGALRQKQATAWEETFEAPELESVTLLVGVTTDDERRLARSVLRDSRARFEEGGT